MAPATWRWTATALSLVLLVAPAAYAQSGQSASDESPWSIDVGIGWDNAISGNVNSSGIGQLDNQAVVITDNSYEDVYGTGLHLRFGGGYALNDRTELIGNFVFQSMEADELTPMGDIGASNLYAQYTDYEAFAFDVGVRQYVDVTPSIRPYGEGTIGVGFIDGTRMRLVAPGVNLIRDTNEFYDSTAAFSVGANLGVLWQTGGRLGFYGQLGLRWMSGLDEIDALEGTGLDDINDGSSRWVLPFVTGVRMQF